MKVASGLLAFVLMFSSQAYARQTFEVDLQLEARVYTENALQSEQKDASLSLAVTPEWYRDWQGGAHSITVTPFARVDSADDERTHGDIRELHWQGVLGQWEILVGISRVFWGRTELLHLVDTINQDDALENLDGEDKLGQPMLRINYVADNGSSTRLFVLPYFRERAFPGEEGRLRPPLPVDDNDPLYQSGAEEKHVDWALRHQGWVGALDYGVAWFSGNQRDPKLVPGSVVPVMTPVGPRLQVQSLRPFYGLMDQFSVDAQYTAGDWLFKLEALWRDEFNSVATALNPAIERRDDYSAASLGFERTFYGVSGNASDIGVLAEYLWDERGDEGSGFQNDLFVGARWAANDVAGTALLAGVVVDLEEYSQFYSVEFSRRIGSASKLSVEARAFHDVPPEDRSFFLVRRDGYLQLEYNLYF
ncbi:hypothetical protein FHR99_000303 [Litorivivens lipolytica]|uniref:Uncharacterized protein n=1 Tax=Litorivivens lipolytica TaxID=1524264 RepID=A0A7W4Z4H0_9GAMM|nr:hypothetical protein [Litorivivens lipolytica]MBB3046067.1 hypothetical protein [Litorivivens lipolytica]